MVDDKGGKLLSFNKRLENRVLKHNHEGVAAGDEEFFSLVARLQDAFQHDYCHSCTHYDPKTAQYRETGRLHDPDDCRWHLTDVLGVCVNYRPRKSDDPIPEGWELECFLQAIRPF